MARQAGRGAHAANDAAPRLSPDAAFVVQLATDAAIEDGRVSGRIEHMATGTSEPFGTLEELLRFMSRLRGAHLGSVRGL